MRRQIDQYAETVSASSARLGVVVILGGPEYLDDVLVGLANNVLVVPAGDFVRNVHALGFGAFIIHLLNTRYLIDDG